MSFLSYLSRIISQLQILSAPLLFVVFSLVTAYVQRFNVDRSGLAADYVMFTILLVVTMYIGGAI